MTMTRNFGNSLFRYHGVRGIKGQPGWTNRNGKKKRKKGHWPYDNWYESLPGCMLRQGGSSPLKEIAPGQSSGFQMNVDRSAAGNGMEQYPADRRNAPKDTSVQSNNKKIYMPKLAAFPKAYMQGLLQGWFHEGGE